MGMQFIPLLEYVTSVCNLGFEIDPHWVSPFKGGVIFRMEVDMYAKVRIHEQKQKIRKRKRKKERKVRKGK